MLFKQSLRGTQFDLNDPMGPVASVTDYRLNLQDSRLYIFSVIQAGPNSPVEFSTLKRPTSENTTQLICIHLKSRDMRLGF